MLIKIDPTSNQPLFAQITDALRAQIVSGRLQARERLPAAKELAQQLDVNLHTVLKSYQQLREEGLVVVRPGRGTQVTTQATALQALVPAADVLLELAEDNGVDLETAITLLRGRADLENPT